MTLSCRRWSSNCRLAWILVCVVGVGCGRSNFELAPVQGTITIDGEPMSEGKVIFAPIAHDKRRNVGRPAFARIQSDGQYRLKTYGQDDGAIVGDHWVTIVNSEESDNLPDFARYLVRKTFQVHAGQVNQIDIDISRKDLAQYGDDDN